MRYKCSINTLEYVCQKCSHKNWEPGTMNDFMIALNGWHSTETNLEQVRWRLRMFAGYDYCCPIECDENDKHYKYWRWYHKKCNTIRYLDRLYDITRTHLVSGYGFAQGYIDIEEKINTLRKEGIVRIYFEELYDIRQFYKGMKGCYMEIRKVS